jgi:hypothetical protein
MRWIDLSEHPKLREHIEAAEKGEFVVIVDGMTVVAYVGVAGQVLEPWQTDLLNTRVSTMTTAPPDSDGEPGSA